MIPLSQIEEMYTRMEADGVDTKSEMLYGYFFINDSTEQLEALSAELQNRGFSFVDIYPDDSSRFWLHVERIEVHDAASLFELNKTLYSLADEFDVDEYDGFDLGNKDGQSAIERDETAVPEEYAVGQTVENGLPCFITANLAFDRFTLRTEFSYFVVISCAYKTDDASLLPTESEIPELDTLEERVLRAFVSASIGHYYVFRKTNNSIRKIYITTNDSTAAVLQMDKLHTSGDLKPFIFEVIHDPEWALYGTARRSLP